LWFFQLRSSSSWRDLNLDCWKARISWTKTFESNNRCTVLLKNIWPSGRHSFIHGFTTSIRTRNDCPESEISAWALLTTAGASSWVYWNLRWTVLKSYILPQRHKRLISLSKKNWIISVAGFNIMLFWELFTRLLWLFTRNIRLSQTLITISGGGTI